MLFGPTLSNSAKSADPIAQASKIVVFGTSNTADGITMLGVVMGLTPNSSRTCSSPRRSSGISLR